MPRANSDPFELVSRFEPDGLPVMPINDYVEKKYRIVSAMTAIFARAVQSKWDNIVYVDLFSGPGVAKRKDSGALLRASPLLVQSLSVPFSKYIFCEENESAADALEQRSRRLFPRLDTHVVRGDCNKNIQHVLELIPRFSSGNTGLTLCFADPYCLDNLQFATIQTLAHRLLIDFLILIPTGMDAVRNLETYHASEEETSLDRFLGTREWRRAWSDRNSTGPSKELFVTDYFVRQMCGLGYAVRSRDSSELVRNPHRQQKLYRLAYFSRNDLGDKLWNEAVRSASPQGKLF